MSEWDEIERRKASKQIEEILLTSAATARKIAETAEGAINGITSSTHLINLDIRYIKEDVAEIKLMLDRKYVTLDQFEPVKKLVYGQTALILIGVVTAVLALVLR